MSIPAISSYNVNSCSASPVSFKANHSAEYYYENPINRKTERNLAILSGTALSALVGVIAGGASTCFGLKGWKIPTAIGAGATVVTAALTLPSKLYNVKVRAFTREKEVDVFSRQKDAQANIYEDINNEINNDEVSLDQKINHFSTVRMADKGQGLLVKGA